HLIHLFHDFIAHLNAHPNIHSSRLMSNMVLFTKFLQPIGPAAPRRNDDMLGIELLFLCALTRGLLYAHAYTPFPFQNQVIAGIPEKYLDPALQQELLDGAVNFLSPFSPQVPDGAIHKL